MGPGPAVLGSPARASWVPVQAPLARGHPCETAPALLIVAALMHFYPFAAYQELVTLGPSRLQRKFHGFDVTAATVPFAHGGGTRHDHAR